jgi:hypothetical protein
MTDGWSSQSDLSVLAPPILPGEALSSWFVRIADAHLVTLDELQHELGRTVSALDRGELAPLKRLAAMTGVDVGALGFRLPMDLIAHPMRPGPNPPYCWAVCEKCLAKDVEAGGPPYIRQSWTYPLATMCHLHREPLIPHGNSRIKIAGVLTLFGEKPHTAEPMDSLLAEARFDDGHILARVQNHLGPKGIVRERMRLRCAVGDVVDALATGRAQPNAGSVMSLFETPLFGRPSNSGSPQLQENWWEVVDAATRRG